MKNPFLKFYPSDWRGDAALRTCSLAARGLWIELLCIMHNAEPYGELRINGSGLTTAQIAALTGASLYHVKTLMQELRVAGVFSEADGIIYSRKMKRQAERSEKLTAIGHMGGNPRLTSRITSKVDPESRSQNPEKKERKKEGSPGSPLPVDWKPRPGDIVYGIGLGLTEPEITDAEHEMRHWALANKHRQVARKSDWNQAFQGWLRRKRGEKRNGANRQGSFPRQQSFAGLALERAEEAAAIASGKNGQ